MVASWAGIESTAARLLSPEGRPDEVRQAARLICLIRVLLLAMAVGVFAIVGIFRNSRYFGLGADYVLALLVGVMLAASLLVLVVPWVVTRWQLLLHLIFDLLWCGGVIYLSGGVLGPGAPLIFAVVLTANMALPRVLPFVLPSIGALVLAVVTLLYLAGSVPFPEAFRDANPRFFEASGLIGTYLVQALALFVVDALGQTLAGRLLEQRLLVGDLLDQIGDGVIALDRKLAPIHVNDEALRLLSLGMAEGRDPLAALQRQPELRPFAELFRSGGTAVTVLPAPERRWLRVRIGDLHGRRGRVIGRVLTLADETELRRAEENARRFEHLAQLGEMSAGIAHEIRNPLAALRGCAQELADLHAEQGEPDAASLSRIIIAEGDRLARIIDDFLRMSRQQDARPQRLLPTETLAQIVDLLRHREDLPAGCSLSSSVADDCPPLLVDPDHLRQILLNLAVNAIEAVRGQPAPQVWLAAAAAPLAGRPAVGIAVCDNGAGIDPAIAADIFTPFVSGRAQGTGLGLAVVQRLLRANGGEIEVRARPEGGSEFMVLLPAG
jgi:two-component system sensor histidine kinase PilS (NtrC family)